MKAKLFLFVASFLMLGVVACDTDNEPVTPNETPETFTIQLCVGGEIDVNHEPLTRFTPDNRDLYSVQVYHKPVSTGSYEHYAYGLFDNVEDMKLEVVENYQYKFYFTLVDDGKDKIYSDSLLVDNQYYLGYDKPFRGRNKYNGAGDDSITKLSNEFTYASDKYFLNDVRYEIKTKDGKEVYYPEGIDLYYGRVFDYVPTTAGETLSIYLKRMIFGLKVNIGDYFNSGTIKVTLADGYNFYFNPNTYTFTPENKCWEATFANGLHDQDSWYTTDDLAKTDFYESIDFIWYNEDGTVKADWKKTNIYFYRMKQTVVNLEYYGEDEVLGKDAFEVHYEDTTLEGDYKTYNYGSNQSDYNW